MSSKNQANRLDQIERTMGHPSDLIIEIYPGGIFLNVGGLERCPKAYGTNLLDFILQDLPPGSTLIRSDIPRKGLFKKPKQPRIRKEIKNDR
jgi:hypothetical protein